MVKVLSFSFEHCFGPFNTLPFEGSSETGLWRHLPNYIFGVRKLKKTSAMRIIFFFLKMFKFEFQFTKCKKNSENNLCFWDNWIWKCCNKLPFLRREYLLLAVNGLTNSPTIFHITERTFCSLNCLHRDQSIW